MEANKTTALTLLADTVAARQLLDDELREKVQLVRSCGASWAEIGGVLGISKQAAQQRYGKVGA